MGPHVCFKVVNTTVQWFTIKIDMPFFDMYDNNAVWEIIGGAP